ncbi:extracellular solute-binding protein [Helcobacillus massiliensis]|uniref:sugar ABC transporter substrate-binding protein n=1 Tax=Helcobacillus massiliensis TaxID=521392 RepID=UPI0021A93CCB|nr:extracellular solute-binding protein [Helcobacillus massiliensis]MCT1557577.1 extracellular solute-binding protein [Helcobacillus massiliensis]MCT2036802.1 extracellular solute-binding protein [Helcobacillus massiliensis]MCT2332445.1 extracellular solute-binding protein [Helcobacillus massiliensis]
MTPTRTTRPVTSRHSLSRRALIGSAAAVGATGILAACAPGSSDQPEKKKAEDISTDVASLGDITLVVWDQEVRGGQKAQIEALNEAFQKKYPNVTIKRNAQSFDDLQKTTSLALSGNDVPDVVQVNNARSAMGEFVKAGQLINLDPYAEKYGWKDRYPESVLAKSSYSEDGKEFGSGGLYGLAQVGEIVGIFYSKKALEKHSVKPPTTWDEFIAAVKTIGDAGDQPMILGNIEKWPGLHVFGPLQASSVKADDIVKLGMGNAGADWATDDNLKALTTLADWGKQKAFGPSPNGLDYDAAWKSFTEGGAAFLPGGSWLAADMIEPMGDDLGFLAPFPGVDGAPATTGGTGIPFAVPAKAKQPDAAAAYIDFITSDDAMKVLAEHDNMPVLNTADLAPESGVNKDIFEAFGAVSEKGTLLPYLDYATPSFGDTAGNAVQGVIGGQQSPEQAAEAMQADYEKFTTGAK